MIRSPFREVGVRVTITISTRCTCSRCCPVTRSNGLSRHLGRIDEAQAVQQALADEFAADGIDDTRVTGELDIERGEAPGEDTLA